MRNVWYNSSRSAGVAHPVERHLAKVEVASSSLVTRSSNENTFVAKTKVFLYKYPLYAAVAKEDFSVKKMICSFLALIICFGLLSACRSEKPGASTDPSGQTTAPTDPATTAPDLERISAPEKLIGVEDVQELTITVEASSSLGVRRTISYSIRALDGVLTFYERNTEGDRAAESFYSYESVCVVSNGQAQMYSNQRISGEGFQLVDLTEEFGCNDGYFRRELANLGFDYADHLTTDGFYKDGETTFLGKECYIYQMAYTDRNGSAYNAQIYVDKQTGLWLRSCRTTPGSDEEFLLEVVSVEEDASLIPGPTPVDMQEQTLYQSSQVTIQAMGLDYSRPGQVSLILEAVNSGDTDLRIGSHYVDVNGLLIGTGLVDLMCPAGQTVQAQVALPASALDRAYIQMIRDLEMALKIEKVHTQGQGEEAQIVSDGFLVEDTGPVSLVTACPQDYEQKIYDDGQLLIYADEVILSLVSFQTEEDGGAYFAAFCRSEQDQPLDIQIHIQQINGVSKDLEGVFSMAGNAEGYVGMSISHDQLTQMGIGDIQTVTLTYTVVSGQDGSVIIPESSPMVLDLS